ncbi:hypothetical protein TIFTF001_021464 [Ficus carica]|uniref:Uncharacterized protein n=1 Tax=Ficus carica TaxID=3494 RepID=A0AA88DBW2_FICCA|nr:hypothetical protein TIFTF001_021464 [Ficus carica]
MICPDIFINWSKDLPAPEKRQVKPSTNTKSCFPLPNRAMEAQAQDAVSPNPLVKVAFSLGTETYSLTANKGSLSISEQLASLKEESMGMLKDYITKHSVPNDVPDEPLDEISSSEDEDEIPEKPQTKSKKTKIN